jgi:preprotein translocase subunit SecA
MSARPSALDRACSEIAYLIQRTLRRQLRPAGRLAREVARLRQQGPRPEVAGLRYRLRRDGFEPALLAECFALYPTAVPSEALAAAAQLVAGGIVELADPAARRHALALAALARAVAGERVHLLVASDAAAQSLASELAPIFERLGLRVAALTREARGASRRELHGAPVLCAAHREVALDYLRDRIRFGQRDGPLRARIKQLSARDSLPPLGKLECALLDDAELAMLDDAQAPVTISAQSDPSSERLMYEQALELARTLEADADYQVDEQGAIRLTASASRRLETLVSPLGGLWSARNRREELVAWALEALHFLRRDADYRVENGRVLFPPLAPGSEEPGPDELEVRKLVEVKEGCRFSARNDVLARLSVPAFLGRYPRLAGVCRDARGLEADFWRLYALKSWRAGPSEPTRRPECRVFMTAAAKKAALLERAQEGGAIFGVRTRAFAQALGEALKAAGLETPLIALPLFQPPPGEAGGAELVVAELPLAARHVTQAAQAWQASGASIVVSLEDEAIVQFLPAASRSVARRAARGADELSPRWSAWVVRRAQRALERSQRSARQELKARDRVLEDLLAVSGRGE